MALSGTRTPAESPSADAGQCASLGGATKTFELPTLRRFRPGTDRLIDRLVLYQWAWTTADVFPPLALFRLGLPVLAYLVCGWQADFAQAEAARAARELRLAQVNEVLCAVHGTAAGR